MADNLGCPAADRHDCVAALCREARRHTNVYDGGVPPFRDLTPVGVAEPVVIAVVRLLSGPEAFLVPHDGALGSPVVASRPREAT